MKTFEFNVMVTFTATAPGTTREHAASRLEDLIDDDILKVLDAKLEVLKNMRVARISLAKEPA